MPSMVWITTHCGLARKASSRFFHCLVTSTIHFTSGMPPQELLRIVDWRFHKFAAVLSYTLTCNVHKVQPLNFPQKLCVMGGSRDLSRRNNFSCCPFSQATLTGPAMCNNGKKFVHQPLISLTWLQITVIYYTNDCSTNSHVGKPCTQTLQVPLVPYSCIVPLVLWPVMVCRWASRHVLSSPLHLSISSPPSGSLMCSGSLCSSLFSSCPLIANNVDGTLPGSTIEC